MRIVLLISLLALPVSGGIQIQNARIQNATTVGSGGGGYTYIYTEDFESGTEPSGWTHVGTVDYGYNTSPAPLVGTLSFKTVDGSWAQYSGLGSLPEAWLFFEMNAGDPASEFCQLSDSSGAPLIQMEFLSGELFFTDSCCAGGITSGSGNPLSTTIRIWFHYKAGTGANATYELWWSATDTIPLTSDTAHYAVATTGGKTAGVDQILLRAQNGTSGINIFDKLRVSTSAIGSSPP